jgi:hypothetical protein
MILRSTASRLKVPLLYLAVLCTVSVLTSSSHREAPMIADDPVADNTDVYAFRSKPEAITIIANYIPFEIPDGGPNYYHFSEDVRYEIHIDNNVATPGDDLTYRFMFKRQNEDPSTFFLIRNGKENLKTTYTCERSTDGGKTFQTIMTNGKVPPPNVGPRSIESRTGLSASDYNALTRTAERNATTGERIFAGPRDDPFFVDAGGFFDLGDAPRTSGGRPKDVLRCKNVHSIALEIDISTLQKDKKTAARAANILDGDYVIGVWASASRQKMSVLNGDGTKTNSGDWIQVSRLGMPLTNEAVIPIGMKDKYNASSPYDAQANAMFAPYFNRPELALYMDDMLFGPAVPALKPLRIQKKSLGQFDFSNLGDGLYPLKGNAALNGTALSEAAFGSILLPGPKMPRAVDLLPIFNYGVPNLPPYQLATGKAGNPLAVGKPFVNNFLPNGGDMLRLNMAVPSTGFAHDPEFSSLGLLQAAVLGLTDPRFNKTTALQFIPNMDGFPNGRRLEDDVTRIELQAVGGIVLAAVGLWYDDYVPGGSPLTPQLLNVLGYNAGITRNDTTPLREFPFVQNPWPGNGPKVCSCDDANQTATPGANMRTITESATATTMNIAPPEMMMTVQNPIAASNTVRYHVAAASRVQIMVYDLTGRPVKMLVNKQHDAGTYTVEFNTNGMARGTYMISAIKNGKTAKTLQVVKQ